MKRFLLILPVVLCFFAAPVSAEVYLAKDAIKIDREKMGGGVGTVHCVYAFTRDKAPAEHAFKEISVLTIPPGASIGYHKHDVNEDSYTVVSGTGVFKDADGKEYNVGPGDMTVIRMGQMHGITNKGTAPLVIVAIIAAQK